MSRETTGEAIKQDLFNEREIKIIRLAAKGLGNKAIALQLAISERTVQSHLISIFRKLQVGSRTKAVVHVLKEGWLNLDDVSK